MWSTIMSDCDLRNGFAYAVFADSDGEEFITQACLVAKTAYFDDQKRDKMIAAGENLFKKEIDEDDTGMTWGLCGDANDKGFKKHGQAECYRRFKREMRKLGVRFK